MLDPPRLLAQRSELGYTERLDQAMPDEPEAISTTYQQRVTADAERQRIARERAAWVDARDTIRAKLATLGGPTFDSSRSELRSIARLIDRIDRRVPA